MAFTNPILPIPIFHLSFSIFIFHFLFSIFHFSFFHFPFFIFDFPFFISHFSFSIFHFPFFIFHFPFSIFHLPFFIYNFSFSILHFSFSIFHLSFVIFHIIFGCVQYPEKYISKYTYFIQLLQLLFYYFCIIYAWLPIECFFPTYLLFTLSRSVMYITSYQIHSLYSIYIYR